MLQDRSVLTIVDNTDVLAIRCFQPRGKAKRGLGDRVTGSVIKSKSKTLKRGDVVHALIINCVAPTNSTSGSGTRRSFGTNAGVIRSLSAKDGWTPVGSRIRGVVPRRLRDKGWSNVVAMAERLV